MPLRPVKLVSNIHGRAIDLSLGDLNILFAPSEEGKSRVSTAMAFAATEKVDGWWGRIGVAEPSRLANYAGRGFTGWFSEIMFADGRTLRAEATATGAKGKKPQRSGTALAAVEVLGDSVMPQRAIMKALYEAGDENRRLHLLRAAARDVTADDVREAMPPGKPRDAWDHLVDRAKANGANATPAIVETLLALRTRAAEAAAKAKTDLDGIQTRLVALEEGVAASGPERPTADVLAASAKRAADASVAVQAIRAAYDWSRAKAAFVAAEAAATAAAQELEQYKAAEDTDTDPDLDTDSDTDTDLDTDLDIDPEEQRRQDIRVLMASGIAMADVHARRSIPTCKLCRGTVTLSQEWWTARAVSLRETLAKQQRDAAESTAAPVRRVVVPKADPRAPLVEANARAAAARDTRKDVLLELRDRILADKAAGKLPAKLPEVDLAVPEASAVVEVERVQAKAEAAHAVLRRLVADWTLIDQRRVVRDQARVAEREATDAAVAIGDAVGRVLAVAAGRYATRVDRYLPTGYKLHLAFQRVIPKGPRAKGPPEVREICEIGIVRPDGTLALNPSGVQQNYLIFAFVCAAVEDRGDDAWAIVIPQDVGADQTAMSRMLEAWRRAPPCVTVLWETAVMPEGDTEGWVVHDVSRTNPAPAESKKARGPRKKGDDTHVEAAVDGVDLDDFGLVSGDTRGDTGDDLDSDLVNPAGGGYDDLDEFEELM